LDLSNIHLDEVRARAQQVGKNAINSRPARVLGGLGRMGIGASKMAYRAGQIAGVGSAGAGGFALGAAREATLMAAGAVRGAGIAGSMAFRAARAMPKPIQAGMYLGMAAAIGAGSYLYQEHQLNKQIVDGSYAAGNYSQPGTMEATGDLVFAMHNLRGGYRPTNI
jgi:hypothetical protein